MNFFLTDIPDRTKKPRENGLTMMMDKGLSINDTKNFIDMCEPHTDIIKLGFGTSAISPHIETKIKLYTDAGLMIYIGGTLFEAFIIRDMFEEYKPATLENGIKIMVPPFINPDDVIILDTRTLEYVKKLKK